MFTVSAQFIGVFKVGDNINHNLEILELLYRSQADATGRHAHLLRKPIIVLLGSIGEAVLYDLHFRMRTYTHEGVLGIPASVLDRVRGKKLDKFELYISSAKKHELLGVKTDWIYDDLDTLRKLRNRIHIQNEKRDFEPNEWDAFSAPRQISAERSVEQLVKIISKNHPRPESVQGHVTDFRFPWNAHFIPD